MSADLKTHAGVEEARRRLPDLIDAAEQGGWTVITRHGREAAVLAPVSALKGEDGQLPLTALAGTGRGLWGADSIEDMRHLRDEWNR